MISIYIRNLNLDTWQGLLLRPRKIAITDANSFTPIVDEGPSLVTKKNPYQAAQLQI